MGQLTLFFSKKVIFFHFLFVFSILYPIFASEFYLNYFIIHFKTTKL